LAALYPVVIGRLLSGCCWSPDQQLTIKNMIRLDHHTQFTTITCLNWLPILQNDLHKQIIIEALKNRVDRRLVTVYAFVIMPNHMHIIWQLHDGIIREDFQRDLLKFTARSILSFMRMNTDPHYVLLNVTAADRKYQVWERNSLNIDIYSEKFFFQKFNYLHNNPVHPKWLLTSSSENYRFSSARFYETGIDEFGLLTHYRG
jgi:putative transposase